MPRLSRGVSLGLLLALLLGVAVAVLVVVSPARGEGDGDGDGAGGQNVGGGGRGYEGVAEHLRPQGSFMGGAHPHFYGDGHDHAHGVAANGGEDPMAGGGTGFIPDHEGETEEEHEALLRMGVVDHDRHHLDVLREQHAAAAAHLQDGGHGGPPQEGHDEL